MNMKRNDATVALAKIISRYKCPEDVDNAKDHLVSQNHFCWGCPWGIAMQDRFVCPFVDGSCARYPQTILHPDPNGMDGMIETYNRKKQEEAAEQSIAEKRRQLAEQDAKEKKKQAEIEARERKVQEEKRQASVKKHVEHVNDRIERVRKIREEMAKVNGVNHMMFDE